MTDPDREAARAEFQNLIDGASGNGSRMTVSKNAYDKCVDALAAWEARPVQEVPRIPTYRRGIDARDPARAETVTGAYMMGIEHGKKTGRAEALEEAAFMTEACAVFYTTVGAIALRQAAQDIRALAQSAAPDADGGGT